jgi:3-isopropylmalate dehydrogenase
MRVSQDSSPCDIVRVGVFPGDGVGPELTSICVRILRQLGDRFSFAVEIETGGPIGLEARKACGTDLPLAAVELASRIFAAGGAILAGAGGGRFVYEMRRHFGLYLKLNPLRSFRGAVHGRAPFDVVIARDNSEGLYQGVSEKIVGDGAPIVRHTFQASLAAAKAVTDAAARLAAGRRGRLTIVAKDSGLPAITEVWQEAGRQSAHLHDVQMEYLDIDFACYKLVREPHAFDVVAAPNCFGDILSDLGGIVMGSRGVTYGASYDARGNAVYQTNHGSALDLIGRGVANPAGQILSLAMMLRETFGRRHEATLVEQTLESTWLEGYHTADMDCQGPTTPCGTERFVERVEHHLRQFCESAS